jgi:hypothetical protein
VNAAQLAPALKLPKGKPVCVVVLSKGDYKPDLSSMEREFGKRVRFVKLDWSSDTGRNAARQFSIQKSPACIVTDAEGHAVLKMEGALVLPMIRSSLAKLVAHRSP